MRYYYLSLGSNIDPEVNSANMIKMLLQEFGVLVSFPFIYTQPEKIKSPNIFLNSVAIVLSPLDSSALKSRLNTIETRLGRDRNDPDKSIKDRPADIDILGCGETLDVDYFSAFEEPYINYGNKTLEAFVDMEEFGLPRTEGATTIHLDSASGDIRILEQAANRLKDWHKSALMTE